VPTTYQDRAVTCLRSSEFITNDFFYEFIAEFHDERIVKIYQHWQITNKSEVEPFLTHRFIGLVSILLKRVAICGSVAINHY